MIPKVQVLSRALGMTLLIRTWQQTIRFPVDGETLPPVMAVCSGSRQVFPLIFLWSNAMVRVGETPLFSPIAIAPFLLKAIPLNGNSVSPVLFRPLPPHLLISAVLVLIAIAMLMVVGRASRQNMVLAAARLLLSPSVETRLGAPLWCSILLIPVRLLPLGTLLVAWAKLLVLYVVTIVSAR